MSTFALAVRISYIPSVPCRCTRVCRRVGMLRGCSPYPTAKEGWCQGKMKGCYSSGRPIIRWVMPHVAVGFLSVRPQCCCHFKTHIHTIHCQTHLICIMIDSNSIFTMNASHFQFYPLIVWYPLRLRHYYFLPDISILL